VKLTPGRAIRLTCLDCVENFNEVKTCMGDTLVTGPCVLYPYRLGKGRPKLSVIRKYCLYCMQGQTSLIRDCKTVKCPFHGYRMGKRPVSNLESSLKSPEAGAERHVFDLESTNDPEIDSDTDMPFSA
jgi:hypothetical protein